MDDQQLEIKAHEGQRDDHNRKTLNRIHRIQGQLAALESMIAADAGSCEARVIQARAVEKGMTSLITHLVDCYLNNTVRYEIDENPDKALQDISRLFDLLNH